MGKESRGRRFKRGSRLPSGAAAAGDDFMMWRAADARVERVPAGTAGPRAGGAWRVYLGSMRDMARIPLLAAFVFSAALVASGCTPVGNAAEATETAAVTATGAVAAGAPEEDKDAGIFQSAPGFYLAARAADEEGDVAKAAEYMAQALKRDPGNTDLLRETFQLKLAAGDIPGTVELAKRVVAALPDNQLGNIVLALEEARAGRFAESAARMEHLPQAGLDNILGPLMQAWALQGEGKTDAALEALGRLSNTRGFAVLHDFHAGFINELAGRTAAAETAFKATLTSESTPSFRVISALAAFYARHGRLQDALALFDDYLKSNSETVRAELSVKALKSGVKPKLQPGNAVDGLAEALFDVASALRQDQGTRLALELMRLSLYLEPDLTVARVSLADILDADRQDAEALALFRSVSPKSPLAFSARLRVADMLREMDKLDEAIKELDALAVEWPDNFEPLATEGDYLRSADRFADAVKAYDRAFARIKTPRPQDWALYYARGVALERAGEWPRAEKDFLESLKLSPDQPSVLNYLGYSWVDRGENMAKAKGLIERAVELKPNDGYIVDSLGWVLYREGEYQRAVKDLERAVELRPDDPVINDHLGDAYWRVGRLDEARFQWRRALTLKPEHDLQQEIGAKLEHGLKANSKPGEKPS